jgi:hypothetical protein
VRPFLVSGIFFLFLDLDLVLSTFLPAFLVFVCTPRFFLFLLVFLLLLLILLFLFFLVFPFLLCFCVSPVLSPSAPRC